MNLLISLDQIKRKKWIGLETNNTTTLDLFAIDFTNTFGSALPDLHLCIKKFKNKHPDILSAIFIVSELNLSLHHLILILFICRPHAY